MSLIPQLRQLRADAMQRRAVAYSRRQACLDNRAENRRRAFTDIEKQVYREAAADIRQCDEQIAQLDSRLRHEEDEEIRAGRDNVTVQQIRAGGSGSGMDALTASEQWSRRTAQLIAGNRGERRAVTSGNRSSIIGAQYLSEILDSVGLRRNPIAEQIGQPFREWQIDHGRQNQRWNVDGYPIWPKSQRVRSKLRRYRTDAELWRR